MVKYCERCDDFTFSWDQVARAFWFRYPNPHTTHVQTEDVLCRKVLTDGKLYSKRLLTKTVRVPCFGKKITIKNEPIIEESLVDPISKTITTYTRNIGVKLAVVEEKCTYNPSGISQTSVERQAWISSQLYFSRAIESYLIRKSRKAINRTCLGFQHVLSTMFPSSVVQENKTLTLMDNAEKFKERAKKATEIAKSRAVPLLAACSTNKQ